MTQEQFINVLIKNGTSKDKIIVKNGLINVYGDVNLRLVGLTEIPYPFGIVTGNFNCSTNHLTTLEGAPKEVGGDFSCQYNQLTILEGAPLEVGGNFRCYGNGLTTLQGAPKKVGGKIIIDYGYLSNYNNVYDVNKEIIYLFRNIEF